VDIDTSSWLFLWNWIVYCICDSAVSLHHLCVCAYKFRHVFLVEKCRLWGTWDVEWVVRIDDIMAVPHIADKKLVFKVRQVSSWNTHMLWILSQCKWCDTVQKKAAVTLWMCHERICLDVPRRIMKTWVRIGGVVYRPRLELKHSWWTGNDKTLHCKVVTFFVVLFDCGIDVHDIIHDGII